MAILQNGILSTTTGKIGNVVGSTWRGKNVLKTHNPAPRNPRTVKQTAQRNIFSIVVAFITSMLYFVRAVNVYSKVNLPAYNIAVSETIKNVKNLSLDPATLTLQNVVPFAHSDFELIVDLDTFSASEIFVTNVGGISITADLSFHIIMRSANGLKVHYLTGSAVSVINTTSFHIDLSAVSVLVDEAYQIGVVIVDEVNKKTSSFAVMPLSTATV